MSTAFPYEFLDMESIGLARDMARNRTQSYKDNDYPAYLLLDQGDASLYDIMLQGALGEVAAAQHFGVQPDQSNVPDLPDLMVRGVVYEIKTVAVPWYNLAVRIRPHAGRAGIYYLVIWHKELRNAFTMRGGMLRDELFQYHRIVGPSAQWPQPAYFAKQWELSPAHLLHPIASMLFPGTI